MDVLGKLCTLEGNDEVIETGLEPEAYQSLIRVLIVSDVQVIWEPIRLFAWSHLGTYNLGVKGVFVIIVLSLYYNINFVSKSIVDVDRHVKFFALF